MSRIGFESDLAPRLQIASYSRAVMDEYRRCGAAYSVCGRTTVWSNRLSTRQVARGQGERGDGREQSHGAGDGDVAIAALSEWSRTVGYGIDDIEIRDRDPGSKSTVTWPALNFRILRGRSHSWWTGMPGAPPGQRYAVELMTAQFASVQRWVSARIVHVINRLCRSRGNPNAPSGRVPR